MDDRRAGEPPNLQVAETATGNPVCVFCGKQAGIHGWLPGSGVGPLVILPIVSFKTRLIEFAQRNSFPLAALFVCLLAFGLLIPWLGFYWDDWLVVFHAQTGSVSDFVRLFAYDRPYSVWTALLSTPLLQTSPLNWHLFALLLRWLTVLAMAWALGLVWPTRRGAIAWAAILFAIYPIFFLQPISAAFSQHLIAYALFFVSLGAMLSALRQPQRFWLWTLLALVTQGTHLFTVEYFAGLELLRPVLLFFVLTKQEGDQRRSIGRVLRAWLPYFLLLALVTLWRTLWLELPVEPHGLDLLVALRANPLAAVVALAEDAAQSLVHVVASAWQRVLNPDLFSLASRPYLLAWLAGALAAGGLYLWGRSQAETEGEGQAAMPEWIWLGLLAIVLGLLPGFLIGKLPIEAGYNERFALPAMVGAALFWIGLLTTIVERHKYRVLILSVMVGLAVAGHLRAANEFRTDWDQQQRLYSQLAWRAPDIAANTALVSFERLSSYMQNSSVSAALNSLYPQDQTPSDVNYWNFELTFSVNEESLLAGELLTSDYRGMHFAAEDASANLLYYLPASGCLWVLSPLDIENPYLPNEARALAAYANPDRILRQQRGGAEAAAPIFGESSTDSWCYYYQKAELARQFGEWEQVVDLMETAFAAGHNPDVAQEWLPLVDAYLHLQQWQPALDLSAEIYARHSLNAPMLCAVWVQSGTEAPLGIVGELEAFAGCGRDR